VGKKGGEDRSYIVRLMHIPHASANLVRREKFPFSSMLPLVKTLLRLIPNVLLQTLYGLEVLPWDSSLLHLPPTLTPSSPKSRTTAALLAVAVITEVKPSHALPASKFQPSARSSAHPQVSQGCLVSHHLPHQPGLRRIHCHARAFNSCDRAYQLFS